MIRTLEGDALFPLPPARTWDLLFGDGMRRLVELSDSIAAIENYELRADGTPRYVMVTAVGPARMRTTSDYSIFERPCSTVNSVLDSPLGGVYEMDFRPEGGGTRVSFCSTIMTTHSALRMIPPAIAPLLEFTLGSDLRTVAERVGNIH